MVSRGIPRNRFKVQESLDLRGGSRHRIAILLSEITDESNDFTRREQNIRKLH